MPHPSEELDDKVSIAQALYKEGFLVIDDIASQPATNSVKQNNSVSKKNNNQKLDLFDD